MMNNNGLLVVVSAPSGCGKDTVISRVLEKLGDKAVLSVSMTTRAMRPGEAYIYLSFPFPTSLRMTYCGELLILM